jgi:hypothetical protein
MAIVLDGNLGITTPAETVQGALTTTGNTILGDASTDTLNVGNGGLVKDASGNVGIGTTVNNVYDQVASARPLVVQKSDTNTTLNGSLANITIVNGDTTTNNTAQLNFAAITGASTNQYSSASISTIFGARTNTVYPSGILTFSTSAATQAPAERMRIDSSGNLLFNSGYGSVATAYGCRAWVNFNGTGTVAIRASGNVSSITDNGTGNYTVNFTTAMVDVNYSAVFGVARTSPDPNATGVISSLAAGSAVVLTGFPSSAAAADFPIVCVSIFR